MRIVFWSNFVSPHTLPFIIKLKKDERVEDVVFVAAQKVSDYRKEMGWNNRDFPGIGNIKLVIAPTDEQIAEICTDRPGTSWHMFPGPGIPELTQIYEKCKQYDLRQIIVSEGPFTYAFGSNHGKPLWLHRLRFKIKFSSYARRTKMLFAMGSDAVKYFKTIYSCPVFNFGYCTFQQETQVTEIPKDSPLRCCFVGALSKRKAPMTILKVLHFLKGHQHEIEMSFIGDGPEKGRMERYISRHQIQNVGFLGFRNNSEIPDLLAGFDVFILPSVHDGWGAVVNEALQTGCFVICSDNCGAKDLLDGKERGFIYKTTRHIELADCLNKCIQNKAILRENRSKRIDWAKTHINGDNFATYMVDCLSGIKASPPWID